MDPQSCQAHKGAAACPELLVPQGEVWGRPMRQGRLAAFACQLVDLLLPPTCLWCGDTAVHSSFQLCRRCAFALAGVDRPACPRCGRTRALAEWPGPDCPACRPHPPPFDGVLRLGQYEGQLRRACLRLKRPQHEALAGALADLLVRRRCGELSALPIDAVVPVPLHWCRVWWRGSHAPDSLARRIALWLQRPVLRRIVRRVRRTRSQGRLSPAARMRNVAGAFRALCDVTGRSYLLVDDVMTTGATCAAVARVLKAAGARAVWVAVVARSEVGRRRSPGEVRVGSVKCEV